MSIWNLRRIGVREPQPAPPQTHPVQEIREGLAFVWNHPLLRTLAWTSGFWHLLFYGFTALHVLFATRVLGMSPRVMGVTHMVGGLGVLASAMMVKPLCRSATAAPAPPSSSDCAARRSALHCCQQSRRLCSAAPRPRRRRMPWSCSGSTAAPCFSSCPTPRCGSGVTPDPMMGRMVATMRCITMAAAPLGALAAGALAEHFSVRTGLACIAAGALALAVATVSGSRLRAAKD